MTIGAAIERYVVEHQEMGKTKRQVLRALRADPIANMDCRDVRSPDLSELIARLGQDKQLQTVGNYMSHLGAVFTVAHDAWGYELDPGEMKKAVSAKERIGKVSKSRSRDRRPTVVEMDALMEFFRDRRRRTDAMPMDVICAFAMFSTRRQEKVCRIAWKDLEVAHHRVLVRDMKHPGEKKGNNRWCELPTEALRIIETQAKTDPLCTGARL